MNCEELRAAVLSTGQASLSCSTVGESDLLVSMPLTYTDGDHPEVLVRSGAGGILTLTDFGGAVARLSMQDVSYEADRVQQALHDITRGFDLMLTSNGELHAETTAERLGRVLLDMAAAMLQIDSLSVLRVTPRGPQFGTRLTAYLKGNLPHVVASPMARGKTGKTYRLTAAVGEDPATRVYIQAIAAGAVSAETRSVEHAFRVLYDVNSVVTAERKVAVLADAPETYDSYDLSLLENVSVVATWAQRDRVITYLSGTDRATPEPRRLYELPAALDDST